MRYVRPFIYIYKYLSKGPEIVLSVAGQVKGAFVGPPPLTRI